MIIVDPRVVDPTGPDVGPFQTPAPPRLTVSWTSWTGDSWTLTDSSSPVFALQGATGLRGADVEHWWADAPYIDGSSWGGHRVARGSIFMPIRVSGSSWSDFIDTQAAFGRSLDPRQEGRLRVTRPDGGWREIPCRYESGMDFQIDLDPVMMLRATYGITWATGDPYWQGEPVVLEFDYTDPKPLFPGPPFVINRARSLASATYSNPGDVPSFPVWRVNGPFDSFTVGVGSSVVSMELPKAADGWVEIDTNPSKRTMLDESGQDCWLYATAADFASIEPGKDVKLKTTLTNAGPGASVALTFIPRYRAAWA